MHVIFVNRFCIDLLRIRQMVFASHLMPSGEEFPNMKIVKMIQNTVPVSNWCFGVAKNMKMLSSKLNFSKTKCQNIISVSFFARCWDHSRITFWTFWNQIPRDGENWNRIGRFRTHMMWLRNASIQSLQNSYSHQRFLWTSSLMISPEPKPGVCLLWWFQSTLASAFKDADLRESRAIVEQHWLLANYFVLMDRVVQPAPHQEATDAKVRKASSPSSSSTCAIRLPFLPVNTTA